MRILPAIAITILLGGCATYDLCLPPIVPPELPENATEAQINRWLADVALAVSQPCYPQHIRSPRRIDKVKATYGPDGLTIDLEGVKGSALEEALPDIVRAARGGAPPPPQ